MCIRDRKKMIGLKEYPAYANTIQNAHADLTLRALETGEPYPCLLYTSRCV